MKHAVCSLSPQVTLLVTGLPPREAVQLALLGRDMPPRLAVFEVADAFTKDATVPDDAPIVWYFASSKAKKDS